MRVVRFRRVADDNHIPTEPGTYRRVYDYWTAHCASRGRPNTYWAETCCPGCGRVALLGSNHTVANDGTVTPSGVCPFPPCTFHRYIALDDWARPSTPRPDDDEPTDCSGTRLTQCGLPHCRGCFPDGFPDGAP